MDIADMADFAIEADLLNTIEASQRSVAEMDVKGMGSCLFCGTKVIGKRWCDNYCRDDWEKEFTRTK